MSVLTSGTFFSLDTGTSKPSEPNDYRMERKLSLSGLLFLKVEGHTMEYYSAIKRNEVLVNAITWINLESIMLNERNQMQNATYYMISFIRNIQNRQINPWRRKAD